MTSSRRVLSLQTKKCLESAIIGPKLNENSATTSVRTGISTFQHFPSHNLWDTHLRPRYRVRKSRASS
ncbi:hypothetical protein K443DRAFT_285872 [Laccaria amethystina LaAM-08-1]|uniref:Uncharacterized protein n=1 Tax=Laccaria amethystina LaAM-08-1 TaxID=1095629 RepID=A0A0C9YD89_9AGAR|nr:hypothetical protein K443DRAFT_285872 [Laccaria amethystina LaAM-08-1]